MELSTIKMLWGIMVISLFPITCVYLIWVKRILLILEKNHPDEWKELGELGLIKNNTISNSNKLMLFLLKKQYSLLNNKEIDLIANKCRLLLIIGVSLSLMAFIFPILIGKYY